jgi:hypothetical protein
MRGQNGPQLMRRLLGAQQGASMQLLRFRLAPLLGVALVACVTAPPNRVAADGAPSGTPVSAPARRTAADSLPRRYDLVFGTWTVGTEPLKLYEPLPTRVLLMPDYRARRWPTDSLRRTASWQPLGWDSLEVRFPSWWSTGLLLRLRWGDTLVGRADVYVDYAMPAPTFAPVRATHVSCPSHATLGEAGA